MQQVSNTTETNQKPLTMAMVCKAIIYNEITPEVEAFLIKNGVTYDRSVALKFNDRTIVTLSESELKAQEATDAITAEIYSKHKQV